jgi:cytochrome b
MLALLTAQGITGLFANDEISSIGPFFGWASISLSNTLTKFHHVFFDALEILIALHVVAVAYYGYVRNESLLIPMITGRKLAAVARESDEIQGSRIVLAFAILVVLVSAFAVLVAFAPEASLSIF